MAHEAVSGDEVVLTTERLLLRPWRVSEAAVLRQLWQERDLRVPPHRRLDTQGRPTLEGLRRWVRDQRPAALGWLAVQRRLEGDVVGHIGLIVSDHVPAGEPEIAFELLRRAWGAGAAAEAGSAVVEWARSSEYERLWATVRVEHRFTSGSGEDRVRRDGAGRARREVRGHDLRLPIPLTVS